jgi:hypothetical protein
MIVKIETRIRAFGLLPLLLLLFLAPLAAIAQAGSFIIAQHGTQVGTATVTFSSNPKGLETTTLVRVAMKGLTYNLSKTEELSPVNHLRHVQLSATVNNSAVNITAAPEAAQILINISANGHSSATRVTTRPAAVFLPDFDPGALDTLLALAVAHNNRDLWAILPKQSGSAAASEVPIQLATYADEQGTLDGKPVETHHLVATIAGARSDLFSGPQNQLLQAELTQQGFAVIRKGFVLTPPAKAGAPPQQAPRPRPLQAPPSSQQPPPQPAAPQAPAAAPVQQ